MEIQDLFKVKCYFKVHRIHIFKIFLPLFIYLEISFPIFSEDSPIIPSEKIVVVEGKKEVKSKTDESFLSGANTEIKLSDSKHRYISLPEILEKEAGVRVRSFGGLGSYSTLSIRGTNPNQSRFFIDGIPFNNSQTGEVNLADLPFDNLEAIELYRSGVPFGMSGSAIGGALNLRTMRPERRSTRINLGGGSFNTGKTSVSHSDINSSKDLGYTIFATGEKSDQNYSFLNDKGTILLNNLDDTIDRRKNAQFERAQGSGSLFWKLGGSDLKLFTDLNHRRLGVTGPGNNQTLKAERKYSKFTTGLSTDTQEFIWDFLRLESRIFFTTYEDNFYDPKSEFSFGKPNAKSNADTKGIQISPTFYLLKYFQIIKFSMGGELEDFRRDRRNTNHEKLESEPIRKRRYGNLQIEDEIHLFNDRFFLIPSISLDDYKDTYFDSKNYIHKTTQFANPRLGIVWKIWKNGKNEFGLKGNSNRASRIASFLELFGEKGQILGNSDLKPEKSQNREFGIYTNFIWQSILTKSEINIFEKNIQDMILFIPNSQFSLRADNIDKARIRGLEISNSITWNHLTGRVNYTYQIAKNESASPALNGKYLPLRPANELYGLIYYGNTPIQIGADITYIGAVFRDRTNEYVNYLPARDIYGAFFTYSFLRKENGDDWKITLEIKNITDKRFSDLIGYPLPGRVWYLNLSMRF
jgi:iron complex outermembrane receptor protein